jgi:hypothetical protein
MDRLETRNEEWRVLIEELEDSLEAISEAFLSPGLTASITLGPVQDGIRRGYCAFHNRRALAETLGMHGLVKRWDEIAAYALLATNAADGDQQNGNTASVFSRHMMELLIELQRAARNDSDKAHPLASP